MKLIEKELSSGTLVMLRPVPPYVVGDAYLLLPEPPLPKVKLESKAGVEEKIALPGTPEWDEYQVRLDAYRKMVTQAALSFTLQYGIVKWKLPDSEEWVNTPPPDWHIPEMASRMGLAKAATHPFDDIRLRYIKYELIQTGDDADVVDDVLQGETSPITQKEVQAAQSPFLSGTPEDGL